MCGKFTAMASWAEVHAFSQPLTIAPGEGSNDQVVTYGVAREVPVIISANGQRRVVMMRWGFANALNDLYNSRTFSCASRSSWQHSVSPFTSKRRKAELTCARSCCAARSSFSYFAMAPEIRSRFRRKARTAIGSPIHLI
jgi:hypothetical protein